jgi:stearoyl-CoA desaturase (Delta-9 desaturase)
LKPSRHHPSPSSPCGRHGPENVPTVIRSRSPSGPVSDRLLAPRNGSFGSRFVTARGPAVLEDSASRSAPPVPEAIAWSTVMGLGVINGLGVVGLIVVVRRPSVPTLVLAGVLYAVTGVSITAGYHRLFAHRSYRASAPVPWFFLAFAAATFQNRALAWSADHRAHHADTDGPGDPHTITQGVWWAHTGWLLRRRIASADVAPLSDLWAIRSVRLQRRFDPPSPSPSARGSPRSSHRHGAIRGAACSSPGSCASRSSCRRRCVNSLAHTRGRRTYDQQTSARDSTITALITLGDGYHSFHHRFPFDYRNGVSRRAHDPANGGSGRWPASAWSLRCAPHPNTTSPGPWPARAPLPPIGSARSPSSPLERQDGIRLGVCALRGSTRKRRALVGTDPWQDAVGRRPLGRR